MYRKLEDFLSDWKYESEATLKVFRNLTDQSLANKVKDNVRTAGKLAWHITTSISEMASRTGLNLKSFNEHSEVPSSAKELADTYEQISESFLNEVKNKWNDEKLKEEDDMYGEKWKKGTTLGVIISHQIHHRAQLTVVMRLNDLKVPGIYGPSKEEWAKYGMPPQE